jgi:hypothetical protein
MYRLYDIRLQDNNQSFRRSFAKKRKGPFSVSVSLDGHLSHECLDGSFELTHFRVLSVAVPVVYCYQKRPIAITIAKFLKSNRHVGFLPVGIQVVNNVLGPIDHVPVWE